MSKYLSKAIKWTKINFDFALGATFFLAYRYFFTWLLWHTRTVPPEPDDSYFYLASANNWLHTQTFEEFRLLPFSIWLQVIKAVSQTGLEKAYEINFYLGPIVMFGALYYFLRNLEVNRKVRLFLITVLALYSGSGAYHGFYWVVPSFYQLALFFLILAVLISRKKENFLKILAFSSAFIFIHPTSILVSTIFAAFIILSYFGNKTNFKIAFSNFKKVTLSMLFAFFIYFLLSKQFSLNGSPESFENNLNLIVNLLRGNVNFISLPIIWREYFAIFFFSRLSIIAYFAMFYFVSYVKKKTVILIFASILPLITVGTIIPYGARTLAFLWPITFIIITYAIVGLYGWLASNIPKLKFLAIIPAVLLFVAATIFNQISAQAINTNKNYNWDRSCPAKLKKRNVFFTSLEASFAFNLYGFDKNNQVFLSETNAPRFESEGNFLVITKDEKKQVENLNLIQKFLISKITRRTPYSATGSSVNLWTQNAVSETGLKKDLQKKSLNLKILYNCGHFEVYKVEKI